MFDLSLFICNTEAINCLIAELHSGSKSRRAEPHNYRARIEIEKTMRLSFHGHRD